jgi:hypothetical protein
MKVIYTKEKPTTARATARGHIHQSAGTAHSTRATHNTMERTCDITGEKMYEGFYFETLAMHVKYQVDALKIAQDAGYKTLEESYDDDFHYYTDWYDEEPNEPEPKFDDFVTFKGKKYPIKSINIRFIESGKIQAVNVSTEELEDALDDSVEAQRIDETIYFYCYTLNFKAGETVQLDQPVKILSVNE